MKKTNLITVTQLSKDYPVFSEMSWRQRIYKKQYGLNECVVRIGKNIFIDLDKFEKWLDSKRWKTNARGRKLLDGQKTNEVKK